MVVRRRAAVGCVSPTVAGGREGREGVPNPPAAQPAAGFAGTLLLQCRLASALSQTTGPSSTAGLG